MFFNVFLRIKSSVQHRQKPPLENDDEDLIWHFLSASCVWDEVKVHQNRTKIGWAIIVHLDIGTELGWSESMNKYLRPRRIINTCLPAHSPLLYANLLYIYDPLLAFKCRIMKLRCIAKDAQAGSKVWRIFLVTFGCSMMAKKKSLSH